MKHVLLVDEAQKMDSEILGALRVLSSIDFDATSMLIVEIFGASRVFGCGRPLALTSGGGNDIKSCRL
jgi:type II secretory pathway predicted ATPase ExeA